jgi:uncharacterized protein HemY
VARAITADPTGSIADADAVLSDAGSSYLDRVIAGAAGASAQQQIGDVDEASAYFERARTTAREAGDIVATELVTMTRSLVMSTSEHVESGHLGAGWKTVAELLAAAASSVPSEPVA